MAKWAIIIAVRIGQRRMDPLAASLIERGDQTGKYKTEVSRAT